MFKKESMRKKKIRRRAKRIKENNRKTVGPGWNTQKTTRRGSEPNRKKERRFDVPIFDTLSDDRKELEKNIKRLGGGKNGKQRGYESYRQIWN